MIVTNVDKAFKYNPARQDRPVFKFYGAGAVSLKSHPASHQRTMSAGPETGTSALIDADQSMALGRHSMFEDEPPLILQHLDGRPISVPGKYLIDLRDKEGDEIEQRAARKLAEKMSKRKRGVPKYYLYDFNQLNERHVDKFRVAAKQTQERRATTTFVERHNQLFRDQKEMES